jgi:DNA polymerase elongation subunit (family B)
VSEPLRLLLLDIETLPHCVFVWSLFTEGRVPDDMIESPGYTGCVSVQWFGEKAIHSRVIRRKHTDKPDKAALKWLAGLIEKADGVITYNGKKFDLPILQREFLEAGIRNPDVQSHIDLYRDVVTKLSFASGKMGYVAKRLGISLKVKHKGIEMWLGCRNGVPSAWDDMVRYNRQDIRVTSEMYVRLRPLVLAHPNAAIKAPGRPPLDDGMRPECRHCGSDRLSRNGYRRTQTGVHVRYVCQKCGAVHKSAKNLLDKVARGKLVRR